MPNWVKNKITINGANAEEIINRHTTVNEYGEKVFDFNTVVKMPDELLIEKGSRSADGLKLYIAKINPTITNIGEKEDKLEYTDFSKRLLDVFGKTEMSDIPLYLLKHSEVETLKTRYKQDLAEVVALGEQVFVNKQKYGCADWYDWSCKNWGTKWNACETYIDGNTVYFDTAWSPPLPVIEKLSKLYPENEIEICFAEEQVGILSGRYVFQNGEIIDGERYNDCSKEAYDMHFELWGNREDFTFIPEENTYVYNEDIEME